MNDKDVVKELNVYLKGEYMGIHAYEHYIKHTEDPNLKAELQRIQQEHKRHAAKTEERIQNLGGKAIEDKGLMSSIKESIVNVENYPYDNERIINDVLEGQEIGLNQAEEIVKGDLDSESLQIIKDNLSGDRAHIDQLNELIQ